MVGQIVYLTILLLVVVGLYIGYQKGFYLVNDVAKSIPIDYEVFGESGVPLITLTANGKKYTFLVDSGANLNCLNSKYITDFPDEVQSAIHQGSFYGADGNNIEGTSHVLTFTYRNSKLTDEYFVTDIEGSMNRLSEDIHKEIHGILGTTFLQKHGMSLDINRMIVWKRL